MKNDWTPQDFAQMWTNRHHIRHIGTNKIAENRTRSRGKVCHSRKIRPKRRREPRVICWRTAMTCHEEEADTNQAKNIQPTSPTVLEFAGAPITKSPVSRAYRKPKQLLQQALSTHCSLHNSRADEMSWEWPYTTCSVWIPSQLCSNPCQMIAHGREATPLQIDFLPDDSVNSCKL
jgi:hypothetical protein